jgi:enterochelin esterase family protein
MMSLILKADASPEARETQEEAAKVMQKGRLVHIDITDMVAFKEKVKLVFVSYGSRELGNRGGGRGGFGGDPEANVEALKQAGINAVFYVSPETAHEWHTWRRCLHQFAPLLFKE